MGENLLTFAFVFWTGMALYVWGLIDGLEGQADTILLRFRRYAACLLWPALLPMLVRKSRERR